MKFKRFIKILSCFIIFTLLIETAIGAGLPDTVKIITEKGVLNTVEYQKYKISVERIRIVGSSDVVYCLEVTKKYPTGQSFAINATENEKINNVIAAGYPNRSLTQLNLDNVDDAYFATQIAIWSVVEGYDVNQMTGATPKILAAIKKIYNEGVTDKYKNVIRSKVYKTSDQAIQEVMVIFTRDLIAETKAESEQKEFIPQEG